VNSVDIDFQMAFNLLVGVLGTAFGWILNVLWSELRHLQQTDDKLAEKVNAIEVIVAGNYIRRDELGTIMREVHAKLDRIDERLNGKVDK
jgi:hypothetical protein